MLNSNTINEYLNLISKFGSGLSLKRVTGLLRLMGEPQDKLKFVHVAGTNGKGSICSMIASVLIEAGYKVGKFVSPHLEEFNERISINNVCISDMEVDRLTIPIKEKINNMIELGMEHPTQFEVICAIGFQYFYEQGCDVVVLEVGLGGRLDSTNVIREPMVSVITSISYDHTDRLGTALADIAAEKAGIIKAGCQVVCYPQEKEVSQVIEKVCRDKECRLININISEITQQPPLADGFEVFNFEGYRDLKIRLLGKHQTINAAVAIKALEQVRLKGFSITETAIYRGLEKAENKGRFEILGREPDFVIDGAHNMSGIKTLKESLERYYAARKLVIVMAVLSTKNYAGMAGVISPLSSICIACEPISGVALPAKELEKELSRHTKNTLIQPEIHKAVNIAIEAAGKDGVVCCCGSLYFIGYVRQYYNKFYKK